MAKEWTVTFLEYVEDTDNPVVVHANYPGDAAVAGMEWAKTHWHIGPSCVEEVKVESGGHIGFYEVFISPPVYVATEFEPPEEEDE